MKVLRYLGCMIIGHNKVLEHWLEGGNDVYFTVCSQCNRQWRMKQLSEKPRLIIKTRTIKIPAHGKIIPTPIAPKISIPNKIYKKQLVNIYLI
ncbi:MAG: hypothetical protein ACE5R3_01885 [Nitrosopumilaceae archaeon]